MAIIQFIQPHKYHMTAACLGALIAIGITGCKVGSQNADELASYRMEMDAFFNELQTAQNALETIDAASDNAESDMLEQIDAISVSCAAIAAAEPPSGYEDVQDKAEHAAAMMGLASSGFHTAFEAVDLDQDAYDAAMEYYKAAGTDIQEMIQMLQHSTDDE